MSNLNVDSIKDMDDLIGIISGEKYCKFKFRVTIWDINKDERYTSRSTEDKKTKYIFGNMLIKNSDLENVDIEIFKDKASLHLLLEGAKTHEVNYDVYKSYTNEQRIMKILDSWNCYYS